jgi:hypothetical protein
MTKHVAARVTGLIIATAIAVGSAGTAVGAISGTSAGTAPVATVVSLAGNTPWG